MRNVENCCTITVVNRRLHQQFANTASFEAELHVYTTGVGIDPTETHFLWFRLPVSKKAMVGNRRLVDFVRRPNIIGQGQFTVSERLCCCERPCTRPLTQSDKSTSVVVLTQHAATPIRHVFSLNKKRQRQPTESRCEFSTRSRAEKWKVEPCDEEGSKQSDAKRKQHVTSCRHVLAAILLRYSFADKITVDTRRLHHLSRLLVKWRCFANEDTFVGTTAGNL
jgi:hypothetical protein